MIDMHLLQQVAQCATLLEPIPPLFFPGTAAQRWSAGEGPGVRAVWFGDNFLECLDDLLAQSKQ